MEKLLTTQEMVERKRFTYWRDAICDVFVQLDAAQLSSHSFSGQLKVGSMNDIEISEVSADSHQVDRSNKQIRKSTEDYFLVSLQTKGKGCVKQDQREVQLKPGDFTLYDSTRPYTLYFDQPFQQIVFQFPRSLLFSRFKHAEQTTSILFPGTEHPVSTMTSTFLKTIASHYHDLDSSTQLRVAETTLDMIAVAMNSVSGIKVDELHSMADIYRSGAKSFILHNLGNPNLSPAMVARNQGISERYLHQLFTSEKQSVAAFIRNKRLEQCRFDLSDSKQIHHTVMEIALQWGFNNAAHFSRIFKKQFGLSPTAYRSERLKK